MYIEIDSKKYPTYFFYLLILYVIVLAWGFSLSLAAYTFFEAQILLLIMILPLLLLAVYAFRVPKPGVMQKTFRVAVVILSVIAMIISALMGYIFLG